MLLYELKLYNNPLKATLEKYGCSDLKCLLENSSHNRGTNLRGRK
jgi:hypothetical protein